MVSGFGAYCRQVRAWPSGSLSAPPRGGAVAFGRGSHQVRRALLLPASTPTINALPGTQSDGPRAVLAGHGELVSFGI
jgi:hypothetical protein